MIRKTIAILFLLSVLAFRVQAKAVDAGSVRFSNITVNEGLAHNNVNAIVQDNNGFIWIGTRDGLCRYDGYTIKTYTYMPNDTTSLPHNYIIHLFHDNHSRLWISTEGGTCLYDTDKDNFKRFSYNDNFKYRARFVYQTSDGTILSSMAGRMCQYNPKEEKFNAIDIKAGGVPSSKNSFLEYDGGNKLLIGTFSGLFCVDMKTQTRINPFPKDAQEWLLMANVTTLFKDGHGNIFIGSHNNGFAIYNPKYNSIKYIDTSNGLSSNTVRCFMNNLDGTIWIGTEIGINILDMKTFTISHVRKDKEDRSGINDNAIYSMSRDNNGNVWVGSYFGGVSIFFADYKDFQYYPSGYSSKHLSGKAVREIHPHGDDHLLIATEDGGLNYFNIKDKSFEHYASKSDKIPLSYHNVHTAIVDSKNNLWVGIFTGGLNRYNFNSGKMDYFKYINTKMPINLVITLLEDKPSEQVLIGSTSGMMTYSNKTGVFTEITDPHLHGRHMYSMHHDKNGLVWIGTRFDGLFTYNPTTGKVKKIDLGNDLQLTFISCLFMDNQDNMWVGTNDGGIIVFTDNYTKRKRYTTNQGLPSNSIMSINQGNDGQMWISTVNGLCQFNPSAKENTIYTVKDGLPTNQFNYSSSYKSPNGELYFGTVDGMISFQPEDIAKRRKNLKVCFTKLSLGGKEVMIREDIGGNIPLPKNITKLDKITLKSSQAKMLSLDFTAFNFSSNDVIYAMKIDNSPWQTIDTKSNLVFPKLFMGNHTLSIKASIDGVNWDMEGVKTLLIRVKAPFALSGIAFAIYLMFLGGISYVVFRIIKMKVDYSNVLKIERVERKNMETLNLQKMDFFTNISHELKTPLTLILSPLKTMIEDNQITPKYKKRLETVAKNANRMLFIIDELITFSKTTSGYSKVTVQKGVIMPFLDEMCQIFRIVALDNDLNFIIDVDAKDERKVWFSPPTIEKIIYNLLSNAFKYTPAGGQIHFKASIVELENGNQTLRFDVTDSGIGIPEESMGRIFDNYYQVDPINTSKGSGIGLAFASRLVKLHRGTINVSSTLGEGSKFTVELQVAQKNYTDKERSAIELDKESVAEYSYTAPAIDKFDNSVLDQPPQRNTKPKILIVEDNRDLNEYICEIFKDKCEVIVALDGKQGYEMAQTSMPDIIISDVMMPELDGFEMVKKLKNEFLTCHIPVVLLTAKTTIEDTILGFGHGADAYIKKPFNEESLSLQVYNILTTRRNNIEKFKNPVKENDLSIATNLRDEKFMNRVLDLIKENIGNEYFSVNDITESIGISRSMLYLKLKNMADVSAIELIRDVRMREAKKRLIEGMNVSEVSYSVGISDPNYFTKCFKKRYGITPTEFIKTNYQGISSNVLHDDL